MHDLPEHFNRHFSADCSCLRQKAKAQGSEHASIPSFDVAVQETSVKVISDCVIDIPLLRFHLPPLLVAEDHIIIPSPLDLSKLARKVRSHDMDCQAAYLPSAMNAFPLQ